MQNRLATVETAGSIAWFLMDASWMFELTTPAFVLAVPTLVLSLLCFAFTEQVTSALLVTGAMACWAVMNMSWMAADLDVWEDGLLSAKIFFGCGSACLLSAMLVSKSPVDFRRLRFTRK